MTSAVVVRAHTLLDCEDSLELSGDAAALFDAAADGAPRNADASVGSMCLFKQKVVVLGSKHNEEKTVFSVDVERVPDGGEDSAYVTLCGPGWLGLSRKLGLAPGRALRFEVSAGGSGNRGLVRASRA